MQNEVPPTIALAHNRPGPRALVRGGGAGTKRLNIIDCTICHSSEDGFRSVANEVALNGRLDIFDDFDGRDRDEILRKLASQYRGNLDQHISNARDKYSLAVFSITQPFGKEAGQPLKPADMPVQLVGQDIANIYNDFYWDRVDPQRAVFKLGYKTPDNTVATRFLNQIVPDELNVQGISLESYAIGRLKDGHSVRRTDFDRELSGIRVSG